MSRAPAVLLSVVMVSSLAVAAAAQEVVGVIVEDATGAAVPGVEITLTPVDGDAARRTVTDEEGRFVLAAGGAGAFTLSVSRLGYHAFTSEPIVMASSDRLILEIRLGVDAVPLEPLVVTGRSRWYPPDITAFYERLERGRRSGAGHFVSRADMEGSFPARTTDLLRSIGGVQVVQGRGGRDAIVRMRGNCVPAIYVDGTFINRMDTRLSLDHYVTPRSIEGIEVYRGAGRAVGHYHDPRGCGLILVWTQRGERGTSGPWRWKTLAAVLAVALALFLITD